MMMKQNSLYALKRFLLVFLLYFFYCLCFRASSSEIKSFFPKTEVDQASILFEEALELFQVGGFQEALQAWRLALDIYRNLDDQVGEAKTLANIGLIYDSQGYYSEALNHYRQGLELISKIRGKGDTSYETDLIEGALFNNIGTVYEALGSYSFALESYEKSLSLTREISDQVGEAKTLANIGNIYLVLEKYSKALEYFSDSLAISRLLGSLEAEASTLNSIGISYQMLGDYEQALGNLNRGLSIANKIDNHLQKSKILDSTGDLYKLLDNYSRAIDYYNQSLTIKSNFGDRAGEAVTLNKIGYLLEAEDRPDLAVTFFKESVNVYESIRASNRENLSEELQSSYVNTIEDTYRHLADLLLKQGRLLEAQRVLELLKVEELRKFTRASWNTDSIVYDRLEQEVVESHGSLIALGREIYNCDPNCSEALYNQQITLQKQYDQIVAEFEIAVRTNRVEDDDFYDPTSLATDAFDLVGRPGTVLIYPIVLEDKLWLLWTATGGVSGGVEVSISLEELSKSVFHLREQLQNPDNYPLSDLQDTAQQLYSWLIEPLSAELEKNKIQHLIFAQDRVTRYLPMAVLHDGDRYLVERYTIHTVLSADLTDTTDQLDNIEDSPILGLGLDKSFPNYNALPNVEEELNEIIQEPNDSVGIYPGQVFMNEKFTFDTLRRNVRSSRILHIATHAEFVPTRQGGSFLLLGTGEPLKVAALDPREDDIESLVGQFLNLHMVVLSACETALGGEALDGTEIAGVSSYFLGKNKAEAVLATLWKVDDKGTSVLMQQFYKILATGTVTKAEALQQAMLSLLYDEEGISGRLAALESRQRGFELDLPEVSIVESSHPYYWAPFVLIGDGL